MLSPTGLGLAAAAISATLVAAPAGWFARGLVFDHFERPRIEQAATDKAEAGCAIRTMDAARRAEQAERARQQAASAEALRIYREALDASERAAEAAASQIEKEMANYAAQLEEEGRACLWTGRDLDERDQWLQQRGAAGAD